MRTIANLLNHEGRVYIFVRSGNITKLLHTNAANEGFTVYGDSALYVLKEDWTLRGVGYVDHLCFHWMVAEMGDGTPIHRVDYGKYLSGAEDYYYKKYKKS